MDYFVGLERIVIDRGLTTPISAKEMALDLKSKASPTIEFIVI
ncbi:hypothetical protein LINPERPRIM_LOCUS3931 [Linum perenne]